jgi:hypothetical protein
MKSRDERIIAVDLRGRSFGFAVFEGPSRLLDWGVRSFRCGVNAVKIPASEKFAALLDDYVPDVVVLRDRGTDGNAKRREMRESVLGEAAKRRIPVRLLSRRAVKDAFVGANRNKYTIGASIAERLPELASTLPTAHKIWMSEEYQLSVFDAAAVGIAYLSHGQSAPCLPPKSRKQTFPTAPGARSH